MQRPLEHRLHRRPEQRLERAKGALHGLRRLQTRHAQDGHKARHSHRYRLHCPGHSARSLRRSRRLPTPLRRTSCPKHTHRKEAQKVTTPTPVPSDYSHPHRPGPAQPLADPYGRVAAASKGNTPARNRMVAILHNAAMDLWDVATEEDPAQMWEEARAIASRILAACPTA